MSARAEAVSNAGYSTETRQVRLTRLAVTVGSGTVRSVPGFVTTGPRSLLAAVPVIAG